MIGKEEGVNRVSLLMSLPWQCMTVNLGTLKEACICLAVDLKYQHSLESITLPLMKTFSKVRPVLTWRSQQVFRSTGSVKSQNR